jgi:hypothetical protein
MVVRYSITLAILINTLAVQAQRVQINHILIMKAAGSFAQSYQYDFSGKQAEQLWLSGKKVTLTLNARVFYLSTQDGQSFDFPYKSNVTNDVRWSEINSNWNLTSSGEKGPELAYAADMDYRRSLLSTIEIELQDEIQFQSKQNNTETLLSALQVKAAFDSMECKIRHSTLATFNKQNNVIYLFNPNVDCLSSEIFAIKLDESALANLGNREAQYTWR